MQLWNPSDVNKGNEVNYWDTLGSDNKYDIVIAFFLIGKVLHLSSDVRINKRELQMIVWCTTILSQYSYTIMWLSTYK